MNPQQGTTNKNLLIIVGLVAFSVLIIIIWYFFYYKPATAPSLGTTNNPLAPKVTPPRFQFLTWGTDDTATTVTEVTDPLAYPLVKIWDKPATGETFITDQILEEVTETKTEGTSTLQVKQMVRATSSIVLFVDKTTGYVYGYPVKTGKVFQISNTIIPGIHDAYFFDTGRRVIMRYVDQSKNKVVGLVADVPVVSEITEPTPLENIEYLTSTIQSVAVNESTDEAAYVVGGEKGSSIYTMTSNKKPILVTSSPFSEWDISYGGDTLYVTTKPSAYVEGATFSLPLFQGEMVEKTGLTTTPLSSESMLHSMWGKNGLVTFLSHNGSITVLPFSTLAWKCSPERKNIVIACAVPRTLPRTVEGLPDDWFQGRVTFNDDLYLIDEKTGDKYSLYSFTDKDGLFDITHITTSDDDSLLSFTRKQDESLWLLNTNLIGGE